MAKRISGKVSVRLVYSDEHECYVCSVSAPYEKTQTMHVSTSQSIVTAVDCPEAYDSAARAAISFAGFLGYADVDHTGTAIIARKR